MRHGELGRVLGRALLGLLGACDFAQDEACPTWTQRVDDRCVLRSWAGLADTLGEPGAREVEVALGPDGHALIAWSRATATEGHVVVAEAHGPLDAAPWQTTEVRAGEGAGVEPAVALGPDGQALLAWKQQRTDGVVYLATRDDTGTWHWPEADDSWSWTQTAYEPRVRFGPDGEAFVLWNQWTGTNFGVALARRAAGADAFERPETAAELLSPPANYSNAPRMAVGQDGEALIAWYQAPIDDLMVFHSERRASEDAFTHPDDDAFLSPSGGPVDSHPQANPWPAVHASGAAAIAWTQQVAPGDIPVFLARRDPDGTWHPPASLDDTLSVPGAEARCPQVAIEPDGALVVTWYEVRGQASEVLVSRRPLDRDDAEGDDAPVRLSTEGAEAVHPALEIGPDGGTLIVWAERPSQAETWQVFARRHQPEHDRWLDPEPLAEPYSGLAATPAVAIDPRDGRVLVAWAQGGVLDGRIRVARLP